MKPNLSPKTARKFFSADSLRLAKDLAQKSGPRRKYPRAVGMKVLPGPGEPLAKSFAVQLVTAETIEAGFPFGIRLEVFADTPAGAIEQATEDFGRLAAFIREQARDRLVEEISRCLGGT